MLLFLLHLMLYYEKMMNSVKLSIFISFQKIIGMFNFYYLNNEKIVFFSEGFFGLLM